MLNFFAENLGTILIGLAVAAVVTLIVIKMRRDKQNGKTSCGCGCEHCPSAGACHGK